MPSGPRKREELMWLEPRAGGREGREAMEHVPWGLVAAERTLAVLWMRWVGAVEGKSTEQT